MLKILKKWFRGKSAAKHTARKAGVHRSGTFVSPRAKSGAAKPAAPSSPTVDIDTQLYGTVEDAGPGKNVLIRNKYVREETGTHETLKILDDSLVDSGEETGIDPYNTGDFDRSRNWDKRFRN
ncbi:MAG: hypothetical protein R3358_08850 [Woeseiaceae bacterium]|nr:hypothetical protein [Woeseiaceae bacterium]